MLFYLIIKALKAVYRKGYGYKKAGIILSDIIPLSNVQRNLFDDIDREKHAKLMKAIDAVNQKEGRNTVLIAGQGFEPIKMNRQYLSQSYTTKWEDILVVKAKD